MELYFFAKNVEESSFFNRKTLHLQPIYESVKKKVLFFNKSIINHWFIYQNSLCSFFNCHNIRHILYYAGVAKLVDVPDLGSGAVRHGGSSPSTRTLQNR